MITGVGLTCPLDNSLREFRESSGGTEAGVERYEIRYFGPTVTRDLPV